jgi:hypothetical protein
MATVTNSDIPVTPTNVQVWISLEFTVAKVILNPQLIDRLAESNGTIKFVSDISTPPPGLTPL